VLQIDLLDTELCEVVDENIRYILRRNPERANQMIATRIAKQDVIVQKINAKNEYFQEHRKAKVEIAIKDINKKIESLKVGNWLSVETNGRNLHLAVNKEKLKEESVLDGCYVIKSNLLSEAINKNTIHDRYKDLALVEMAFRNCKTTFLEVRPVHVRKEKSTRGHVLTVMLSYKIIRHIEKAWRGFDLTVQEGVDQLSTLCSTEVKIKDEQSVIKIPKPRQKSKELLDALDIRMPEVLPKRRIKVDTKKKLMNRR